jgi:tRNA-binding protein
MATYEDFLKIDIRTGKIISAEAFPEAKKPAYKLRIDFGPLGIRKSSAQVTKDYTPKDLVGRLVAAVVNFPPKQVATFVSEVLVLGVVPEEGRVILLRPDKDSPLGKRVL